MNLAEQILRRKHAAMYKPPVVQSQEQVITPAPNLAIFFFSWAKEKNGNITNRVITNIRFI